MELIRHSELKDMLLGLNGASFVSIKAETVPELFNKGGRMGVPPMLESVGQAHNQFKKFTSAVGLVSCGDVSYTDFVNNRLEKEAKELSEELGITFEVTEKFEAKPHNWAVKVEGSNAVMEHKDPAKRNGKYYLAFYFLANNKPISKYQYNGESVDIKDSKYDQWRKKDYESNQPVTKPIGVKDYKFESIKEITINKQTYTVVPD